MTAKYVTRPVSNGVLSHGLFECSDGREQLVANFLRPSMAGAIAGFLNGVENIDNDGILSYSDLSVDTLAHKALRAGRWIQLTPLEFKLAVYLLSNPEMAFTYEEIYVSVWGRDVIDECDFDLVRQCVYGMRRKLGEPRLIQTLRGFGYKLEE